MTSEDELIQKLVVSKKIMERHNEMGRNGNTIPNVNYNTPEVDNYEPVSSKYNIPQEFLQESNEPYLSAVPAAPVTPQPITADRVLSSKLPDAIKRLMIEHPIEQPTSMGGGATLSNDIVEKAARLMNSDARGNQISQPKPRVIQEQASQPQYNQKQLREMLKEVVEEVLTENGILAESSQKSNEVFSFKVGKHIFEGKVTKIKKIS